MKHLLTLLTLSFGTFTIAQWQYEGSAAFSPGQAAYTDLVFDAGIPYVAFRDFANSNKASVMTFDGSTWNNVGTAGFTPSGALSTNMKFYNTYPHVAFIDAANTNRVSLMAYDGANWQDVGSPGFSGINSDFVTLDFIGATPYVSYQDGSNGSKVSVMSYTASTWSNIGPAGFNDGIASSVTMTILGGVPYVAFQDVDFGNEASVMYFNGTNWVYLGGQAFTTGGVDDIVITNDGTNVYIAFQDQSLSQRATVMMYDGASWVVIGAPGFTAATASYIDITFESGDPYIVYQDAGNGFKASVMTYDGANWIYEGLPGFTPSQSIYNSIAFDVTGTPFIAFQDYAGGGYNASVMKHIPCIDPEDPTISVSATTICQGESFTITVDAGNLNSATSWHLYAGGCTGASIANSPTGPFTIFPTGSATYYLRGEGGCVGFIPCITSTLITFLPVDTTVTFVGGIYTVGSGGATAYQWIDCNNAFAPWIGDTNQTFLPPVNGTFAVSVTENGCVDTSECHTITNLGVSEFDSGEIKFYPNPVKNILSIELAPGQQNGNIKIIDLQGKEVLSYKFGNEFLINLDITFLYSGLYFIILESENEILKSRLVISK